MSAVFANSRKSGKILASSELELLKATSMASLQSHDTVLVETEAVQRFSKKTFFLQVCNR